MIGIIISISVSVVQGAVVPIRGRVVVVWEKLVVLCEVVEGQVRIALRCILLSALCRGRPFKRQLRDCRVVALVPGVSASNCGGVVPFLGGSFRDGI